MSLQNIYIVMHTTMLAGKASANDVWFAGRPGMHHGPNV